MTGPDKGLTGWVLRILDQKYLVLFDLSCVKAYNVASWER